jgi:hypothetical protein
MIRAALLLLLLFISILLPPSAVQAADWLTLVGTEPRERDFMWWGIVQPLYIHDYGESLRGLSGQAAKNNGKLVLKNTGGPWFDEREEFSIQRFRLGARGRFTGRFRTSFTKKMSYFFMVEAGQNAMTYRPLGDRQRPVALSDMFLTFYHVPHVKIQAGLFKNPGPEDVLQPAGFFCDYIQRTSSVGRDYLEIFARGAFIGSPRPGMGKPEEAGLPQTSGYGFSAARDWGIQTFNSIRSGKKWLVSWALKLGRGESISSVDTWNNTPEIYLYTAAEYRLPGGRGVIKNGIKLFSWFQWGRRSFATDPQNRGFDRFRYGFGFKALGEIIGVRQRLAMDFMMADGMIFMSPAGNVRGGFLRYATGTGNRNRGITCDYGIYIRRWQLNYRWHLHQILYHSDGDMWTSTDRRNVTEHTIGIRYNFTDRIRVICDFMMRDVTAPDNDNRNTDIIINSVRNRIALQFTWIF